MISKNLIDSPNRYRWGRSYRQWDKMQIYSKWEFGGMCPWQAYLRVKFRGIKYTIYVRDRHNSTTIEVLYGWHGFKHNSDYFGTASHNLLTDNYSDEISKDYYDGEESYINPLLKKAEDLGYYFFEENKYNSYLPRTRDFER